MWTLRVWKHSVGLGTALAHEDGGLLWRYEFFHLTSWTVDEHEVTGESDDAIHNQWWLFWGCVLLPLTSHMPWDLNSFSGDDDPHTLPIPVKAISHKCNGPLHLTLHLQYSMMLFSQMYLHVQDKTQLRIPDAILKRCPVTTFKLFPVQSFECLTSSRPYPISLLGWIFYYFIPLVFI